MADPRQIVHLDKNVQFSVLQNHPTLNRWSEICNLLFVDYIYISDGSNHRNVMIIESDFFSTHVLGTIRLFVHHEHVNIFMCMMVGRGFVQLLTKRRPWTFEYKKKSFVYSTTQGCLWYCCLYVCLKINRQFIQQSHHAGNFQNTKNSHWQWWQLNEKGFVLNVPGSITVKETCSLSVIGYGEEYYDMQEEVSRNWNWYHWMYVFGLILFQVTF